MKKEKILNLFVGSNNQGKIKEIRALLPKNLKISTPRDYSLDSPNENGRTFDENSLLKAKYLVDEGSMKNWSFIIFLVLIAMLMIANAHNYEQKIHRIEELKNEVESLKGDKVELRSIRGH